MSKKIEKLLTILKEDGKTPYFNIEFLKKYLK